MMDTYGVIGDPVEHSLSPPMQRAALQALGIDADYSRFRVREGDVTEALKGARSLGVSGLNVTVPHKQRVAELPIVVNDETADRIGAVNTVDMDRMKGYNTDAAGARRAVEEAGVTIEDSRVVVVGAGGAGRAVAYEFGGDAARIDIANRTASRAADLADELSEEGFEAEGHALEELDSLVPSADLVVNTTSVGMNEDVSPVPKNLLHGDQVVFDVVYTPLETRLLREARSVGARTVDGASMLVHQGAEAFEIWTGREAPVEEMLSALKGEL